ncbi:homogentisate 1,2-dioxygenase [Rhodococcus sp. NPDC059968]|uniref:homogentisate 1,2-dioxygenase n=1 Tax=Rhodococcus sp. NPDC059968 TaxID=3347017 RepID=UPI0036724254
MAAEQTRQTPTKGLEETMTEPTGQTTVLYTRNGFAGPMATMVREQYPPQYTRVVGDYAPRILDLHALDEQAFDDVRSLPVSVLEGPGLRMEVSYRKQDSVFGLRNVFADEVHVVLAGSATLETEFGVLRVAKDDLVLIPRATTYRFVDVKDELREYILASETELSFAMQPGLGPLERFETPAPYADPSIRRGEFETVVRHGNEFTSIFTDYDPLPTVSTEGTPLVTKVNINDLRSIGMESGLLLPPLLFDDATTQTFIFDLSARSGSRPPVHYNADYDECILFMEGPGSWGAVNTPGLITHTPKGLAHQGPVENVPEGYRAILIETRCKLKVTAAGRDISHLAETDQYSRHPSESQLA